MKPRSDLVHADAREGVEIFQLTEGETPWCHLYMEAQVFSADSKRLIVHKHATAHGGSKSNPDHQYYVCDLESGGDLMQLTNETGVVAPSISPVEDVCYYFVDEAEPTGGRVTLKRVNLDGTERGTVIMLDGAMGEAAGRLSKLYPLSTIRSDGKRLAISGFLGDGKTANAPFGLVVFDLEKAEVACILEGPTWANLHAQYCRSRDLEHARDILSQENHGVETKTNGSYIRLTGGDGADIHVIRDDGSGFRNLPWGRDGNEFCQGHQCWRGRSHAAITSTAIRADGSKTLVESEPVPFAGHVGIVSPGGKRNVLSRTVEKPQFCHFATDIAGKRFITDALINGQWRVYTAEFGEAPGDPLTDWRFVIDTHTDSKLKNAHAHPFLSPDGTRGFFNGTESGVLHAYMATGIFGA